MARRGADRASRSSSGRIRATGEWRERFACRDRPPRRGACRSRATRTSTTLATLLQHADAVVSNAGTILLDALVNDRPAVCVLYDEGAPPGESWAAKNVIGEHYRELAASVRSTRRARSRRSWPGSSGASRAR